MTTASASGPTALLRLFVEQGQSPWLDHVRSDDLGDGSLSRLVAAGIRGVTGSLSGGPATIESDEHDAQTSRFRATGRPVQDAHQGLAVSDVLAACAILRPVFQSSQETDGFVSVEAPSQAPHRAGAALASARWLHHRIDRPNLLVAIPAQEPAVRSMVSIGANINATSIFSVERYSAVIDAYLCGLEAFIAGGGDPVTVHSVATFSVSRVDGEVDKRLDELDDCRASGLRGVAGVAQAKLAYRLFEERFSTDRWASLARRGANPQPLLWASCETDDRQGRQTGYVEELIGPDTVYALSESAVAAFEDHGVVGRTLDTGLRDAACVLSELAALGIDLDEVAAVLENQRAGRPPRVSGRAPGLLHTNRTGR